MPGTALGNESGRVLDSTRSSGNLQKEFIAKHDCRTVSQLFILSSIRAWRRDQGKIAVGSHSEQSVGLSGSYSGNREGKNIPGERFHGEERREARVLGHEQHSACVRKLSTALQGSRSGSGQRTPPLGVREEQEKPLFLKVCSILKGVTMCFCHLTPWVSNSSCLFLLYAGRVSHIIISKFLY